MAGRFFGIRIDSSTCRHGSRRGTRRSRSDTSRSRRTGPSISLGRGDGLACCASGPARTFRSGEVIFEAGARRVPTWLVLQDGIEVVRRDGLGSREAIAVERAGHFSGNVSHLSDRGAAATGRQGPRAAPPCRSTRRTCAPSSWPPRGPRVELAGAHGRDILALYARSGSPPGSRGGPKLGAKARRTPPWSWETGERSSA